MINKDFILRLAERIGREISIFLGLRDRDEIEEALIDIDEMMFRNTGLTSRVINALSEEMLLKALSPLGRPNVEACLWIAALLKTESILYARIDKETESYYRAVKALYLYLEVLQYEPTLMESSYISDITDLIARLESYELPAILVPGLLRYYEHSGLYARVEDILMEHLEAHADDIHAIDAGEAFYQRLQQKDDVDLQAGNFLREEIDEGLQRLAVIKQV